MIAYPNLAAEFDVAVSNLTDSTFKVLAEFKIEFEAILRAGYVGVEKILTTGRTYSPDLAGFGALILGVWHPRPPSIYWPGDAELVDILAIRPTEPTVWWHRAGEHDLILGRHLLVGALDHGLPVRAYRSPIQWMQGGCDGFVDLDQMRVQWEAEWLLERAVDLRRRWDVAA